MSESDISDIVPIINLKIIRRCFYELQPRNPKNRYDNYGDREWTRLEKDGHGELLTMCILIY